MQRRKWIKTAIGLTATTAAFGAYAWQIEPFWLEIVQRKLHIANLPEVLNGHSLMQISDIHVSNKFDHGFIIESFETAQRYDPDFVVYTGDYITYENDGQFDQLKKVMSHAVKGRLGTVAILGNHDYGPGWKQPSIANRVTDILTSYDVRVLRNESTVISGLQFIGLDDYWGTNFEPRPIFQNLDPDQAKLVLCHNPDVCDLNIWKGYQGWILSGHTHGGQVRPPFLDPMVLPVKNKKYTAGEINLKDGRMLYINRALGHLIQVRLNVRPEITLFELERI